MFLWAFMVPFNFSMAASRIAFAWSLDGFAPLKLSYVTERFRIPLYANLVITLIAIVALVTMLVTKMFMPIVFGSIAATLLSMLVAFIAAVTAPLRKDEVKDASKPALIGGGVVSIIFALLMLYFYVSTPQLGFIYPPVLILFLGAWAVGFIWYYVAVSYRKSRGQDLTAILKALPPRLTLLPFFLLDCGKPLHVAAYTAFYNHVRASPIPDPDGE